MRGSMVNALFNIKEEPHQEQNLYAERPDIVKRLMSSMRDFIASINAPAEQHTRLGLSNCDQEHLQ
jgi:hypothetical protein